MRNWLGIGAAIGFVTALPIACSSTPVPPFQTVGDFCSAKAKAECQIAAVCAIDSSVCTQVRNQVCLDGANQAVAPPSTRQYYQPNAQACINKVQSAYSQGNNEVKASDLFGPGSIDDLCNRVFQGTADTNTACTSNYDCTNNGVCTQIPGESSVCGPAQQVPAGGFCANPGSECATGTYCAAVTSGAPQCKAKAAMGTVCSAAVPCLEGLRCVGGACSATVGLGSPCDTNADCGANYCDTDVPTGAICTIGLTFAGGAFDCKAYSSVSTPGNDAGVKDSAAPPDTGAADSGASSDAGGD